MEMEGTLKSRCHEYHASLPTRKRGLRESSETKEYQVGSYDKNGELPRYRILSLGEGDCARGTEGASSLSIAMLKTHGYNTRKNWEGNLQAEVKTRRNRAPKKGRRKTRAKPPEQKDITPVSRESPGGPRSELKRIRENVHNLKLEQEPSRKRKRGRTLTQRRGGE